MSARGYALHIACPQLFFPHSTAFRTFSLPQCSWSVVSEVISKFVSSSNFGFPCFSVLLVLFWASQAQKPRNREMNAPQLRASYFIFFNPSSDWRARPSPLRCKNEYMVFTLRNGTAAQVVVGSIVWAFRRFKKPRCRGYALHISYFFTARSPFSFLPLLVERIVKY